MGKKVGVLVVDDSPIGQAVICRALGSDPDLEVLGVCGDGEEALQKTRALRPSVITMDVDMPRMDGLSAVQAIMAEVPTPILVITGDPRHQTPEAVCRALELGALGLQMKPALDSDYDAAHLAREVKLLANVAVIRHVRGRHRRVSEPVVPEGKGQRVEVIAIGSSTGGPQVVHRLLKELPRDFPIPIALVQHINPFFTESLAAWLNNSSRLQVRLAQEGDRLEPGRVLVAPALHHMWIETGGRITLKAGEPRDGHIPSVSALLESAGRAFGSGAVGVVLTGMGSDGAEGLSILKRCGGRGIAQSRESSVVFGMPGSAVAMGGVDEVIHGDDLGAVLMRIAGRSGGVS